MHGSWVSVKKKNSRTSDLITCRWYLLGVRSLLLAPGPILMEYSYCLTAFMLWFGWLGFNGASVFGANLRAVFAIWNSMLMAAVAGIVWCLMDYRYERRWTMVGFCSGTIAGLVAATPSSGYINPWASVVVGVLSGALCNLGTKSEWLKLHEHNKLIFVYCS